MRGRLAWVALPFLLVMLCTPALAMTVEEVIAAQEESVGIDALERAAKNSGGAAVYGESLNEGLADLLDRGSHAAGGIIRSALRSGVLLMVIILMCGFSETVYETAGAGRIPAVPLVGALAIAAVAVADVNTMLGLGRETIDSMASFANVLFPTMTAVTAATGAVTGAAVRQMAAAVR